MTDIPSTLNDSLIRRCFEQNSEARFNAEVFWEMSRLCGMCGEDYSIYNGKRFPYVSQMYRCYESFLMNDFAFSSCPDEVLLETCTDTATSCEKKALIILAKLFEADMRVMQKLNSLSDGRESINFLAEYIVSWYLDSSSSGCRKKSEISYYILIDGEEIVAQRKGGSLIDISNGVGYAIQGYHTSFCKNE